MKYGGMAPRSTLDAQKLVLTMGAGRLVFTREHLGFLPLEFLPLVFSACGSSIWGTSTGRSSTLTHLAFCTRTVFTPVFGSRFPLRELRKKSGRHQLRVLYAFD